MSLPPGFRLGNLNPAPSVPLKALLRNTQKNGRDVADIVSELSIEEQALLEGLT
ncbi:MAG TPA: hypothetical protein VIN93_03935 [Bryobacteraceae bacterium]